ncbi:hypothetical protein [Methyloceanibacter sp.]|uniref:hypothetical protein n=1 Tax=Methyloceanibacter sp. TaxID=1965321 RepID=UPI003D6CFFEA
MMRFKSISLSMGLTLVGGAALLSAFASAAHAASCRQWDITGSWTIEQTNGFLVDLKLQQDGNDLRGTASFTTSATDTGTGNLDGSIDGNSIQITIYWGGRSGAIGEYKGTINPRGRLEGDTFDRMNPVSRAGWHSLQTGGRCVDSGVTPQSAPGVPVPVTPKEPDLRKGLQKPGKFFQQ